MSNIRRLINLLIYILLAPVIGHEEACTQIAEKGRNEDRIYERILKKVKARGLISARTIEEELIMISKNFETSGVDSTVHFEYLQMKVTEHLTSLKKRYTDMLSAVLTGVIGIFMFSIMLSLFASSLIMRTLFLLTPLAFIINIHMNQIEMVEYDYVKPLMFAALVTAVSVPLLYVFAKYLTLLQIIKLALVIFSVSFSFLYIPQLYKFIDLILNINRRIIKPIHELLWNPTSVRMRTDTLFEKEINRLVELGRGICSPWFIGRVSRLVDYLVDLVKSSVRSSMMYGLFIPVGFLLIMYSLSIFTRLSLPPLPSSYNQISNIPIMISLFNLYNKYQASIMNILGCTVTSVLTGKTLHSIGLGICIIPVMLLISKMVTGL
ncbi:MAG: hypothetical protein GXO23_06485 [Crenarchaeota archaeon]|nr:hypothetical protein [Thermoproteota archaeon]